MGKLIIWLVHHPDVQVRFNYNEILKCLQIRVIRDQFTAERVVDPMENYFIYEKFVIEILNDLYDSLEKEEKKYASD